MNERSVYRQKLLDAIRQEEQEYYLMEVCGTHTMAIAQSGIRELLPPNIHLLSGPGCPVCVTSQNDIDAVIYLVQNVPVTLVSFGDMMRVPGSVSSLQEERGRGADIRVAYSPLDALRWAREMPEQEVVFLGIGFETTAPTIAAVMEQARSENLKNFSLFSLHKFVPPALYQLFTDPDIRVDGLICPGHVAAVLGLAPFEQLAVSQKIGCVVTGFEGQDILEGILMLLRQIKNHDFHAENQYRRIVKDGGNAIARRLMDNVFITVPARWRGLGMIPDSGLTLRPEFKAWDARERFAIPELPEQPIPGCSCGEVLCGKISPVDCPLFAQACTPLQPIGPCMVSQEGACAAWYRFRPVPERKVKKTVDERLV